ncbi:MAG: hypothetical protein JSW61_01755, partial [Candidatus Thorarchaeota archaeon]
MPPSTIRFTSKIGYILRRAEFHSVTLSQDEEFVVRRIGLVGYILVLSFLVCIPSQYTPLRLSPMTHLSASGGFASVDDCGGNSGLSSVYTGGSLTLQPAILGTEDLVIEYGESAVLIWNFTAPASVTYAIYRN